MKIVLGFGSNLGDRKNIILQAYELLEEKLGTKLKESSFIETEAWGFESENLFLNSVAIFETKKTPRESLVICNEDMNTFKNGPVLDDDLVRLGNLQQILETLSQEVGFKIV